MGGGDDTTGGGRLTRRRVVQAGGAVALATGLAGASSAYGATSVKSVAATVPGGRFRRSTYQGLADYTFRTGGVSLELVAVEDVRRARSDLELREHERAFSLLFEGPSDAPLAEGLHTLSNEETGDVALYLVPVGPGGDSPAYEAVIDRATVGARRKAPRSRRGVLGGGEA